MTPQRIQRRRTRGWRLPEGAIIVTRPTKWGNPFRVYDGDNQWAVQQFEAWIKRSDQWELRSDARRILRGHDLVCWCKPGVRCHADVLLRIANEGVEG